MSIPPICPIEGQRRSSINRQFAWLLDEFGRNTPEDVQVVLPTREFFPRAYDTSVEGLEDTFVRLCDLMNEPQRSVRLWFFEREEEPLTEFHDQWERRRLVCESTRPECPIYAS
jgi:hypothetical protein